MKARKIYKEIIESIDARLGRHIHHDSESKNYKFDTTGLTIKSVEHIRTLPALDQGEVGSCTGNAGVGVINTQPFYYNTPVFLPTEDGALSLYSAAEVVDGDGPYPPQDHGSSGLSIAKVLKNVGMISGYQHNFSLQDTLKALTQYPLITGTNWYNGMFTPDADGRVHPTGTLAGGHEYEAYKIDVPLGRIWFWNSWGAKWGIDGTFYMTWADYAYLLSKSGDSTVLLGQTANPNPAPLPVPLVKPTVNTVTLTRGIDNGVETVDSLHAVRASDGKTLVLYALELPWKDNAVNISCIPKGIYTCSLRPFYNTTQYQVLNVEGRSGIFIHSGNYYHDILGCILVGLQEGDINGDGEIDVTNSVAAVAELKAFFSNEDFQLEII